MWMYIGFGLAGYAVLVLIWVSCNKTKQRNKDINYSKNYGARKRTKGKKDSKRGGNDDSDDFEQMMAKQPTKQFIREYHDRFDSEDEYNSNMDQRQLPKKMPFRE